MHPESDEKSVHMSSGRFRWTKKQIEKYREGGTEEKILPENVHEKLRDAIDRSLERGDPNAIRVVSELVRSEEARKHFTNIKITIVPYTIKDTSLTEIVMKAPDYVIKEIKEALIRRGEDL